MSTVWADHLAFGDVYLDRDECLAPLHVHSAHLEKHMMQAAEEIVVHSRLTRLWTFLRKGSVAEGASCEHKSIPIQFGQESAKKTLIVVCFDQLQLHIFESQREVVGRLCAMP